MKCLNCNKDTTLTAGFGPFGSIDEQCKHCGVMYFQGNPVAVQKGNKIIPFEKEK